MASYHIDVMTIPRGQQRHRTANGHQYTPTETRHAQWEIRQAWEGCKFPRFEGALEINVLAVLCRPRSHYGSGRNAGRLLPSAPPYPIRTPDWDNLGKLVSDALNGVAYPDDGAIVCATVAKRYAGPGERPGWHIYISEVE